MVSGLNNQTNILNRIINTPKQDDIKTLLKYVSNESLQTVPDSFSSTSKNAVSSAALFEGIPLLNFIKNGKKVKVFVDSTGKQIGIKDALKAMDEKSFSALKNIFTGKEGTLGQRIANYVKTSIGVKQEYANLKEASKTAKKAMKAVSKGKNLDVIENAVSNAVKAADKFVDPKKAAVTSAQEVLTNSKASLQEARTTLDRLVGRLNLNPNSKKLNKAVNTANKKVKSLGKEVNKASKKLNKAKLVNSGVQKAGKLSGFKNFLKSSGAGLMLVFSGVSELFSEVIPTFKELGLKSGIKQIGKSAFKVVADTAGFIAGEQAFTAIGSAIGTAICPGIGTIVGSVCGFIGGMIGSFAAGKLTKAVIGKTERQNAQEQIQQQQINYLQSDANAFEQLKIAAKAKVEQEAQTGQLSQDSIIALQTLQSIESNPFVA